MSNHPSHSASFFKTYVLPVALVFLIPAVGWWFAGHAESRLDDKVRTSMVEGVRKDSSLTAERKAAVISYFEKTAMSQSCRDGAATKEGAPPWVKDVCGDYAHFGWIRRLSLTGLIVGGASLLVILLSVFAAFSRRAWQVPSFAVGWNFLRLAGAVEVVTQGAIAVLLSYWMTAVWTNSYYPKLIFVIGALAVVAVFMLIKAIFQRAGGPMPLEGTLIDEARAPELWRQVRETCAQMDTEPPAHIVGGIDDNFFVTESPAQLGHDLLTGRTLYISLALLKVIEKGEANGILAHEMAHFSGGDTAFSKRLSPMLLRYEVYLAGLHEGGLSIPVFYLMLCYRSLFELALAKDRRRREFEADAAAARLGTPEQIGRALLKTSAYANYRGRVEAELFEHTKAHDDLAIADRVRGGFASYAASPKLAFDLHDAVVPHPFDSHPPLRERLEALGVDFGDDASLTIADDQSTWFDAIDGAEQIEREMWEAYEARFAEVHEESLAFRYLPANDEERALVEKYFPAVEFDMKDGDGTIVITYAGVTSPEWGELSFDEINSCEINKRITRRYLDMQLDSGKRSICINKLQAAEEDFLAYFNRYWSRSRIALESAEQLPS